MSTNKKGKKGSKQLKNILKNEVITFIFLLNHNHYHLSLREYGEEVIIARNEK